MQSRSKLVDDLSKVASSAMSTLGGLRDEAQGAMQARLESALANMDMVTREEFEAIKAMALKAREENDALAEEIKGLKALIEKQVKPAPRARKAPARKKAVPKPSDS